jgi:hypothetical protein
VITCLINRTLSEKQNSTTTVLENTKGEQNTRSEFNTQVEYKFVQTATQFKFKLAQHSLKRIGKECHFK